jgi:hypothetical protein
MNFKEKNFAIASEIEKFQNKFVVGLILN